MALDPGDEWQNPIDLYPESYVCGFCSRTVGPNRGYRTYAQSTGGQAGRIYICSYCRQPTYIDPEGRQWPGAMFGAQVDNLPNDVAALYEEARRAMSVAGYTAAVLLGRKILMHTAAAKGAPEGQNFVEYVGYLANQHYIPPDARPWVDHIRTKGNEANHEIRIATRAEADELMILVALLLTHVYDIPAKINPKPPAAPQGSLPTT